MDFSDRSYHSAMTFAARNKRRHSLDSPSVTKQLRYNSQHADNLIPVTPSPAEKMLVSRHLSALKNQQNTWLPNLQMRQASLGDGFQMRRHQSMVVARPIPRKQLSMLHPGDPNLVESVYKGYNDGFVNTRSRPCKFVPMGNEEDNENFPMPDPFSTPPRFMSEQFSSKPVRDFNDINDVNVSPMESDPEASMSNQNINEEINSKMPGTFLPDMPSSRSSAPKLKTRLTFRELRRITMMETQETMRKARAKLNSEQLAKVENLEKLKMYQVSEAMEHIELPPFYGWLELQAQKGVKLQDSPNAPSSISTEAASANLEKSATNETISEDDSLSEKNKKQESDASCETKETCSQAMEQAPVAGAEKLPEGKVGTTRAARKEVKCEPDRDASGNEDNDEGFKIVEVDTPEESKPQNGKNATKASGKALPDENDSHIETSETEDSGKASSVEIGSHTEKPQPTQKADMLIVTSAKSIQKSNVCLETCKSSSLMENKSTMKPDINNLGGEDADGKNDDDCRIAEDEEGLETLAI